MRAQLPAGVQFGRDTLHWQLDKVLKVERGVIVLAVSKKESKGFAYELVHFVVSLESDGRVITKEQTKFLRMLGPDHALVNDSRLREGELSDMGHDGRESETVRVIDIGKWLGGVGVNWSN